MYCIGEKEFECRGESKIRGVWLSEGNSGARASVPFSIVNYERA